jgi:hypothetical protein
MRFHLMQGLPESGCLGYSAGRTRMREQPTQLPPKRGYKTITRAVWKRRSGCASAGWNRRASSHVQGQMIEGIMLAYRMATTVFITHELPQLKELRDQIPSRTMRAQEAPF